MRSVINSSLDIQNKENSTSEYYKALQFTAQLLVAYVVVFVASLFGNSVIIHTVIRTDNSMKTTTNYLILNQACADILTTLTELLNFSLYSINTKWFGGLLGMITCKVFKASIIILPISSVWILVTVAVDRFYAVNRPLQVSPLSRHFKKTILLLWVWATASSTNAFALASLEKNKEYHYCIFNQFLQEWKQEWKIFAIVDLLNIFLPLLIIAVLYTFVCLKLWSRDVPGEGANQHERQAEAMETARKVTRMMIVVAVLFVVCWLPFIILLTSTIFGYLEVHVDLHFLIILLSGVYSGLNPYVYFTFNQKFRNGLKHFFGNCIRKVHAFRSESVELEQI